MKGNLTVEASLVFPFCFIMIGIVCCLGVFLYDQVVLKITGYECILQAMDKEEKSEEDFLRNLKKQAELSAKNRTLAIVDLQADIKISTSKILVNYHGKQKLWNLPIDITVVCQKVFPEQKLRLARKQ